MTLRSTAPSTARPREEPPAGNLVGWLGHACVRIDLDGARLLTDPLLTAAMLPLVRRRTPHRVAARDVEGIDAVLISHAHPDHLHLPSLRMLASTIEPGPRILVPAGAGRWLERRGFRGVQEVRAGDRVAVRGVAVHAVPASHQGYRVPLGPRAAALGYVLEGTARIYFAGDTALFPAMADIPRVAGGGLDLALLPVGGWGPTLRGGHMGPRDAAEALRLLRPRRAVPVHWGTYWPLGLSWFRRDRFERPGEAFREAASDLAPDVDVHVLRPGDAVAL